MSNINNLTPKLLEILEISDKLSEAICAINSDEHRIPWRVLNELMKLEKAALLFNEKINKSEVINGC